ncbi:MAG TPA: Pls/PosA family non-ribosomal peptide synthetase [Roseiarcus sp.]|nr:Pls/PosA family non-ribosomal peptide synthetase [Roseiarcus sp.]
MYISALDLREPSLEQEPLAGLRRPEPARPASVLSESSALRWRYGERLSDVIEEACRRHADRIAVSIDSADISYRELDARANQMARFFRERGVKPGDRVAVLLDRGVEAYVALLALLKAGAAYVPLDASHPPDRIRFIASDAGATLAVTHLRLADRLADCGVPTLVLDGTRAEAAALDRAPLAESERGADSGTLCYVLYTSGTTGNPKGVAVAHPSICNFVRVAADLYGLGPGDRVYQGMSAAFDFSIEEIWVPLVAGATLVPNTGAASLFGEELADFLESRGVTCLCCVPTLLASIERELPKLSTLLIGGEACPPALVKRWSRPGRTLLNSYGPTETTVTATLAVMTPDKPVTIGKPLPTYSIVILDAKQDVALELGEAGEIGIAGIGVAEGYLNRPELTRAKFIDDFLALPNNPSGRIYRTGDLGRIGDDGEIEYLGRIDTQTKLRGYRIELTEIESVLLEIPEIAQVVATTFEPEPGAPELVAYYSVKHGARAPDRAAIVSLMRARLPSYMTPAYLEQLPFIPTLLSNKADRKELPAPKSARLRFSDAHVPPKTETERALCEALSDVLGLEQISIDGDFFAEYGAHSLLMARFCAKVRQLEPSVQVAMRDVYAHTTVRRLARALDAAKPAATENLEVALAHRPSSLAYYGCGAAQMAVYAMVGALAVVAFLAAFVWIYEAADSPLELYGRALAVAAAWFLGHNALAVAAKWLLIGRARACAIPLWSFAYFRFWAAKLIVRSAPANAFAGTPLFNAYLRLLGARIDRNAVILSRSVPVTADLFEVGEEAVVMRSALAPGYVAAGNRIHTGEIRIGRNAYVGEQSVLDIRSAIGDFGQLGHASSLQSGQRVPEGKRYAGSPAEETTTNFRLADEASVSAVRRWLSAAVRLAFVVAVAGALTDAVIVYAMAALTEGDDALALNPWEATVTLLPMAAGAALAVSVAALVAGLLAIHIVPRLANAFLVEGRVYPLYGFRHTMQQIVQTFGNSRFFNLMFGDSVFIEPYLRWVGWKLGPGDQTGSNFGSEQGQDNPFLCSVGANTVASDGLWLGNLMMSSRAFKLSACRIGEGNFLGTTVYVPPGARTGDNVLFGTKVMAPIDGPVRENVGLLGSPAFEIPRAASRDLDMLAAIGPDERARRLVRKTRLNVASIAALLASRWLILFIGIYVFGWTAAVYGVNDVLAMIAAAGVVVALSAAAFILIERASLGFGSLKPEIATVYDPAFWRVERHWKLSDSPLATAFAGTPMRNVISRLLGVKVGRRAFDDGCILSERTLVEIGDEANLNEHSIVQAHSLEEGVFKSDFVRIGPDCSVGVGCLVHYGVTMNENTHLDADAFLMKGEITPAGSRWRGNPAKLVHSGAAEAR